MRNTSNSISNYSNRVSACFLQYYTLLEETEEWMSKTIIDIDEVEAKQNPFSETDVDGIQLLKDYVQEISDNVQLYRTGDITKDTLLHLLFPQDNKNRLTATLAAEIQKLKSDHLGEVVAFGREMERLCNDYYRMIMLLTVKYSAYQSENYVYQKTSRLAVWRGPTTNEENPSFINYRDLSFAGAWVSNEPIEDFQYESTLSDILSYYFEEVAVLTTKFNRDLPIIDQLIQQSIKDVEKEYVRYTERRQLNGVFIK